MVVFKVKVTVKVQNFIEFYVLSYIFCTNELFATKLGQLVCWCPITNKQTK